MSSAKGVAVIVTVSSRHMDVTPALKSFCETKANKLLKYYDRIQEIEVVLTANHKDSAKNPTMVEMIVNAEHKNMFIAHHADGDTYACIDQCVDKLERQLTEHKKKIRNRKHPEETRKAM
jgi:putative sigma-54 modulation protein